MIDEKYILWKHHRKDIVGVKCFGDFEGSVRRFRKRYQSSGIAKILKTRSKYPNLTDRKRIKENVPHIAG